MEPVYRGMPKADVEREYSPSSMVGGDISSFLADYATLSQKARAEHTVRLDLSYGGRADEVVDFFPAAGTRAPLHIFVHGGYWQALSHKDGASFAPMLLERGVAFAAFNYTLAPQARIETMVDQLRRALGALMRRADDLGFDASRVSLSGHSAGAHLVAMLLAKGHLPENSDLPPPCHATLISGVFDLTPLVFTSINDPLHLDAAWARALSPAFRPQVLPTPVLVAVGEFDTAEFRRQSREHHAKLQAEGRDSAFLDCAGVNHFDIITRLSDPDFPLARALAAGAAAEQREGTI